MKKKSKITILLYFLLSILGFVKNINCYYCDLFYLETNKSSYYYDDFLKFNASWDLNYNINKEISYFQVQIWDNSDFIIWNSSKFYDVGLNNHSWTLKIQDLNHSFNNYTNNMFIKAFHYIKDISFGGPEFNLLKSISINVLKRNISCEIFGFKNILKYGEFLSLKLKFFCLENNSVISNQVIEFKIISKDVIIHREVLITNQTGFISTYLSTVNHLKLGKNTLLFNISDNVYFEDSCFQFSLKVERFPVLVELFNFQNRVHYNEEIQFDIFYYYINRTICPLISKEISLKIFLNNILKTEKKLISNISGIIKVNISQKGLELKENSKNIFISLFFNGSKMLQNHSLNLNIDVISQEYHDDGIIIELILFSLIGSSITFCSIFFYNKKRLKSKLIKEISFKI